MKPVLLTGLAIALVDGVVLGVALGLGHTSVAMAAAAVGVVAAVVLGYVTPPARTPQDSLVTLGTQPTPEPVPEEPDVVAGLVADHWHTEGIALRPATARATSQRSAAMPQTASWRAAPRPASRQPVPTGAEQAAGPATV